MNSQPAIDQKVALARSQMIAMLGITVAAALIVVFSLSWLDSRNASTIVFLATPKSEIAVDVRGAVSTPDVVFLSPGARVTDAVDAAGGFSPDADRSLVNLSTRVFDGQMLTIPTQAPVANESQSFGLININTASVEELKQLPGVGDVIANRIVNHREINGPFQSPDELIEIDGLSSGAIETILPMVTVSGDD